MAHVITLKNGENIILQDSEDLRNVIEEHLGYEFARELFDNREDILDEVLANEILLEKVLINTGYYAYESSLEDNHNTFEEIVDLSEQALKELEKSRINKQQIIKLIDRINTVSTLSL